MHAARAARGGPAPRTHAHISVCVLPTRDLERSIDISIDRNAHPKCLNTSYPPPHGRVCALPVSAGPVPRLVGEGQGRRGRARGPLLGVLQLRQEERRRARRGPLRLLLPAQQGFQRALVRPRGPRAWCGRVSCEGGPGARACTRVPATARGSLARSSTIPTVPRSSGCWAGE